MSKIFLKDGNIHMFLKDDNNNLIIKPLGDDLLQFIRFDYEYLNIFYFGIIKEFLNNAITLGVFDHCSLLLAHQATLNNKCYYFSFYTETFFKLISEGMNENEFDMKKFINWLPTLELLWDRYLVNLNNNEIDPNEYLNSIYSADYIASLDDSIKNKLYKYIIRLLYIKDSLLLDITKKQSDLEKSISYIYDVSSEQRINQLSYSQKLYLFDSMTSAFSNENLTYINKIFSIKTASYPLTFSDSTPLVTTDYIKNNDINIIELYEINSIDDLICFEMIKLVENNVLAKKCMNCNNYFAPEGRIDTIYCDSPFEDTSKTCAEIGSTKKYNDKTKDNPIHIAFNKAYKRNNSRVRSKKMTKQEFYDWSKKARDLRTKCLNNKMEFEQFLDFLNH